MPGQAVSPTISVSGGSLGFWVRPRVWNAVWTMLCGESGTTDDFIGRHPTTGWQFEANNVSVIWTGISDSGFAGDWLYVGFVKSGTSVTLYIGENGDANLTSHGSKTLASDQTLTIDTALYAFNTASYETKGHWGRITHTPAGDATTLETDFDAGPPAFDLEQYLTHWWYHGPDDSISRLAVFNDRESSVAATPSVSGSNGGWASTTLTGARAELTLENQQDQATLGSTVTLGSLGALSFWLYPTWNSVWSMILGKPSVQTDFVGYRKDLTEFRVRAASGDVDWTTNLDALAGGWHHFVISRDGSTWELFVDGVSKGTSGTTTNSLSITSLGYAFDTASYGIASGAIADIQVHNNWLFEADAAALKTAGEGGYTSVFGSPASGRSRAMNVATTCSNILWKGTI